MNLSKSRYVQGCTCPKILWMQEHMPEQYDPSVIDESRTEAGNVVGDLAMGYYGPFVEVPFEPKEFTRMAARTAELLAAGTPIICEAAFLLDGNFCMVDILRVEPGGVRLTEVKSATHVKDYYLNDVAYQCWVLERCGLRVKSAALLHVNSGYVRDGELDLQGLFTEEDLTEVIRERLDEVPANVRAFADFCAAADEPWPDIINENCLDKDMPCGFAGWCTRCAPRPGVLDINRLTRSSKVSLYNEGVRTFSEVVAAGVRLTRMQEKQVRAELDASPALIDVPAIREFLGTLSWPLYFLDFETMQPAVPLFDGTRPYQQVTTQYSLHIQREPGGELEHREFLAPEGESPLRAVAEHLVADIPFGACTLAYNMQFERSRIREMAAAFPDLAAHLKDIARGMRDLMVPFKDGAYYDRAMGGSYSIKAVLPALCPDDPSLDYHGLEGVHNGGEAMTAYANLVNLDAQERAQVREQLLRYCELDTLAMVRVLDRLMEAAGETPGAREAIAQDAGVLPDDPASEQLSLW